MLKSCEIQGFFEWVRIGGADKREIRDWLICGATHRSYLDAYEHFVLGRREL
jgi:hypothetical protein